MDHSKSSASVTPDKVYCRKDLVTLTSYPFRKYSINPIERTETHGSKHHYNRSDYSNTERSYGEGKL